MDPMSMYCVLRNSRQAWIASLLFCIYTIHCYFYLYLYYFLDSSTVSMILASNKFFYQLCPSFWHCVSTIIRDPQLHLKGKSSNIQCILYMRWYSSWGIFWQQWSRRNNKKTMRLMISKCVGCRRLKLRQVLAAKASCSSHKTQNTQNTWEHSNPRKTHQILEKEWKWHKTNTTRPTEA